MTRLDSNAFGTPAEAFLRIRDRGKLTPTLARHVLKLGLSPDDERRMGELAERHRESTLTPDELRELDDFLNASLTLSALQSRARQFLSRSKSTARRA